MKLFQRYFVFILFSLFAFGCASSSMGVATSNKPVPNVPYDTLKTVEKTFTWYAIDFVVFGISTSEPPIDSLYEKLMDGESGDAIVNIRYWNDKSIFGPLTRYRFSIKGDLVKFQTSNGKPKR
ncbi:hypothetical protein P3G55_07580 [Leptospira sp. 96542]|nr:hypothetical protein [Leptospira sp. 96542]